MRFDFKKEFLESFSTFFSRATIGGVFIVYSFFLVGLKYSGFDLPGFIDYMLFILLDLYLVTMVVTEFKLPSALNILQKRLLWYLLLYFLLNLISAPLILAVFLYFFKIKDILLAIASIGLVLVYFYFIFIRIYFLAPILILSKESNPWNVVKDAWRKSKRYQVFLLKVAVIGMVFYGLSIVLPVFVRDDLLSTALIVLLSGVSLPVVKILFVRAGLRVLKK